MKRRMARVLAMVMAVVLMGTSTNVTAFAAGICDHHLEHTAECGYVEAVEGADCTHVHDEECYSEVEVCVHEHDENCGYAEGVEDSCTHTCSVESRCITTKENCNHSHDENCGYVQAVEGSPCTYACEECAAEVSNEEEEEAVTCTCETDDPAIHATNCPAYVAPENPVCTCAMKCSEDTLNVWCDICGVQGVSACQGEDTAVAYDENVNSSNCGATVNDNVTWNFDSETGTLTISGTGAMADYDDYPEWSNTAEKKDSITKIVIGYGVTRIGDKSFYNCNNVTEVVFERNENGESSITSIGDSAMRGIKIEEIVIPASVETIGKYAFRVNRSLTTIEFEEGSNLKTLEDGCFMTCPASEWILPSKVTTIGRYAFRQESDVSYIKTFYYPTGAFAYVGETDKVFENASSVEYFGEYTINETDKTCSVSYIGLNTTTWLPDDTILPDEAKIVIPDKIDGYKVIEAKIGDTIIYKYTEPHADDGNDNNTSEETKGLKETEEQIFTRELLTKVAGAKAGDNVVIDATIWHSFSAKVLEQLFAKEGVSYTIYYYFEGEYFYITIPANAALEEGCDWYGPLKLNAMFGRTMITKAEYEEAIAKLQEQAK